MDDRVEIQDLEAEIANDALQEKFYASALRSASMYSDTRRNTAVASVEPGSGSKEKVQEPQRRSSIVDGIPWSRAASTAGSVHSANLVLESTPEEYAEDVEEDTSPSVEKTPTTDKVELKLPVVATKRRRGYCFRCHWSTDAMRWPVQAMVCLAILSIFCVLMPQIDSSWLMIASAVQCIESTAGASIHKSIGRSAGAIIGGLMGLGLYLSVTWGQQWHAQPYLQILLWLSTLLLTAFLSFVRYLFKQYAYAGSYGIATGTTVIFGAWSDYYYGYSNTIYSRAFLRMLFITIGVIFSSLVSMFVLPNRARPKLVTGVASILRSIGETLQPIVELDTTISMTKVNGTAPSMLRHDVDYAIRTELFHDPGDDLNEPADFDKQQVESVMQCSVQLSRVGDKLKKLEGMRVAAKHEFSRKKERRFETEQMQDLLTAIKVLYYQVSTLCYTLARDVEKKRKGPNVPEAVMIVLTAFRVWESVIPQLVLTARNIVATLNMMALCVDRKIGVECVYTQLTFVDTAIVTFSEMATRRTEVLSLGLENLSEIYFSLGTRKEQPALEKFRVKMTRDSATAGFIEDIYCLDAEQRVLFWEYYFKARNRLYSTKRALRNMHYALGILARKLDTLTSRRH